MKSTLYLFFSIIMLFFVGCKQNEIYHEESPIETAIWDYNNPKSFTFSISDTAHLYNMFLLAEYSSAYSKQNIYLRIKTKFPNGRETEVVRSYNLFNMQGERQGDCSGEFCTLKIFLQENTKFKETGDYTVVFEQYTREPQLAGLQSIGLAIEKVVK